jgi:hypothetical protein
MLLFTWGEREAVRRIDQWSALRLGWPSLPKGLKEQRQLAIDRDLRGIDQNV